jgi:hypothetical protein
MDLGIFKNTTTYKTAQQFFVQRLLELLDRQTIDSYRLRVMNPYLMLLELREVYEGFMQGTVKNFQTLEYCIKEAITVLQRDEIIRFEEINKKYFLSDLLNSVKKDRAYEAYPDIFNALKLIISANQNYTYNLYAQLESYVKQTVGSNDDIYLLLEKIDVLTGHLATELMRLGYSKSYLFKYFRRIFIFDRHPNFDVPFATLDQLIRSSERRYKVWFKVNGFDLNESTLTSFSSWEIRASLVDEIDETYSKEIQKFATPSRHYYIGVEIKSLDHYSALTKAKRQVSENFDVLKLAYHRNEIRFHDRAWVIDLANRTDSELQKIRYIPDGQYPQPKEVLPALQSKIPGILQNSCIVPETKEKIKSAIRYLRYGNEAFEIEHQFINYWIGLEYLFSNDRDSTFTRIKEILPALQVLLYIRRNLVDFFNTAKQPFRDNQWEYFDPKNLDSLLKENALEEIRDQSLNGYPLLSYRSWKFKKRLFNDPKRSEYLKNHQDILEQHLVRIYRFRNEIVHEARHGSDNQTLASNLKYYLTFSLSIILDHFSRIGTSEPTNLEDFFALQRLRLASIRHEKYPIDKLLHLDHDFEMLT